MVVHGAAFISEQLQYKIFHYDCPGMNISPCIPTSFLKIGAVAKDIE